MEPRSEREVLMSQERRCTRCQHGECVHYRIKGTMRCKLCTKRRCQ